MKEAQLERAIGLPHAVAMVVGTIIGASIFVQPSEVTGQVPGVWGIYAVWAVSGILTLCGALVCAELASVFPESGGVYAFLREAFSPALGFLWGWAMFWTMHSGIIAAIAMVCARYVGFFVPLGDVGIRLVAVVVIVVLSAVNYVGVRHGTVLQTTFTAGKLLAVAAIIAIGFGWGGEAHEAAVAAATGDVTGGTGAAAGGGPAAFSLGDFALALVAGLFAFGGWHMVTYQAEETVDARSTIPRALVIGTLVVTASYILLNAVYLHVLPLDVVAASDRVAADAADAVLGRGGGMMMSGLVVFSTFGALAGIVLAGPRVYYAMARDGLLFEWLAEVHPTYRTPHRAIVLQAIWSSVLVSTGTYRALFTRVIYTEWIFFGLMAVGLVLLRRRREEPPPYRVPLYPAVPVLFALSAFAIVANQIANAPVDSALGLGFVLVGWPVYVAWTRRTAY